VTQEADAGKTAAIGLELLKQNADINVCNSRPYLYTNDIESHFEQRKAEIQMILFNPSEDFSHDLFGDALMQRAIDLQVHRLIGCLEVIIGYLEVRTTGRRRGEDGEKRGRRTCYVYTVVGVL
jgi:hypothetical protein